MKSYPEGSLVVLFYLEETYKGSVLSLSVPPSPPPLLSFGTDTCSPPSTFCPEIYYGGVGYGSPSLYYETHPPSLMYTKTPQSGFQTFSHWNRSGCGPLWDLLLIISYNSSSRDLNTRSVNWTCYRKHCLWPYLTQTTYWKVWQNWGEVPEWDYFIFDQTKSVRRVRRGISVCFLR